MRLQLHLIKMTIREQLNSRYFFRLTFNYFRSLSKSMDIISKNRKNQISCFSDNLAETLLIYLLILSVIYSFNSVYLIFSLLSWDELFFSCHLILAYALYFLFTILSFSVCIFLASLETFYLPHTITMVSPQKHDK